MSVKIYSKIGNGHIRLNGGNRDYLYEMEIKRRRKKMDAAGRNYLTGSILLSRSGEGGSPEEYIIKSVIGEGGSTVCYEAVRKLKDGVEETGKLKEFYPVDSVSGDKGWYYSLERLPNGQLVPCAGTIRKFREMCRDYISTYKLLRKVMADNPKNEVLKNYIQHGEILYGCMEDRGGEFDSHVSPESGSEKRAAEDHRNPTVYIWSPGVAGKGFDTYLEEVRRRPEYRPEERLRDILCVIDTLTDCIKALHTAGLMHMDIKPSNFLVPYNSDFTIQPNQVSLFDINTLCSIESEFMRVSGTEGYCAPEVLRGKADNRSDIYSIGAMLFYAVVITEEIPDGLYRDSYYSGIDQFVKHSALFLASETNSDAALMSRICKILEKCLVRDPRKRYQSCSELKVDLDKARKRLNKMLWTPVEKSREGLTEPQIVLQKLLYDHPLYEAVSRGKKELNVLVVGSGTYGQKFIDLCLQTGQMPDVHLRVTAVSDEPEEDKAAYLRFRPGLADFVDIDGAFRGKTQTACAELNFRNIPGSADGETGLQFGRSAKTNEMLVREILTDSVLEQREYHYIFVALGEDRISRSIAKLCSEEAFRCWGTYRPVCYISQKVTAGRKSDLERMLYPVCINMPLNLDAIDHNLGQMAFYTHLSWNSGCNPDIEEEQKRFFTSPELADRYNRASSVAYALSIKYKLHSVSIDCSDPHKAAELFSKQVLERRSYDEEARQKFYRLADLEHRRWVLEKTVDGWTAPRDETGKLRLEECVLRGSVKDEGNRTHPCLVMGSERSPLSTPEYQENHYARWDEGEIDPELDELDRMSVELHRCFKRHADRMKAEGIFQNPDLNFIQSRIPPECEETWKAFKQFQFVLKNILNGVQSYSQQYYYYQEIFRAAAEELPDQVRVQIEERIRVIKSTFFPVVESNLYRDYKANDTALIEKIPFILSCRQISQIVMAFEDGKYQNGRNEAVFASVASATMLNPRRIRYLYCFDRDAEAELLIRRLDAVFNYYKKRNMCCGISIIVCCPEEISDGERDQLSKGMMELKERYPQKRREPWMDETAILNVKDYEDATAQFVRYVKEHSPDLYDGSTHLFASAYDNGMFIEKINRMEIPYFELDWRSKTFTKRIGCEFLRFTGDRSFFRVQDMFALMNASDRRFHLPEFADDYEELWKIYTGEYLSMKKFENGVGNWNRLCISLKKHEEEQKPLAKFVLRSSRDSEMETFTYFLPEYTYTTVQKLLKKLMEYGVADRSSRLVLYASDTCRLELRVHPEYKEQLDIVFFNPQKLLPYYGAEAQKYKLCNTDYVEIRCSHLAVKDVDLDWDGSGRHRYSYEVLKQLEKSHFISQLKQDPGNTKMVSFVYSSPRIRKLLTSPGAILEIYAYYDVLKTGYFDDVAAGYEFYWESGGVKNELDLILTKGFRSIIVECKAVVELKLDYYHKLDSIADQFGIGTIKVLLGNTYAQSNTTVNDLNEMQRSRGKQLGIRTISDKDELLHIGRTLQRMMEET